MRAAVKAERIFQVTLREGRHPVPVEVRLRRLLKRAGRDYGLACLLVEEITAPGGAAAEPPAPGTDTDRETT